jgi:hypothetical protein
LSGPRTRQLYRIEDLQLSEYHVTIVCISAPYIRSLHAAEDIPALSKLAAFRCGIVETFVLLGCCADSLVFGYRRFGTIYLSQLRRSSVIPFLFLSILFHFLSFFSSHFLPFIFSPFLVIIFSVSLLYIFPSCFNLPFHFLVFVSSFTVSLTYFPSCFTLAS